ncbi:MAG TPA: four helix bundle protein [Anaerolineales bacterium]|nr:four helix bundle protein [Anaerolineales bacterium]
MDNVRFCYNARGSLDETLNHLIAARDLGYCPISLYEDLRSQIEEIRCLLNGYISWLKTKKIGQNEPGAKLTIREASPEYLA